MNGHTGRGKAPPGAGYPASSQISGFRTSACGGFRNDGPLIISGTLSFVIFVPFVVKPLEVKDAENHNCKDFSSN
jgi:hypothetical protein